MIKIPHFPFFLDYNFLPFPHNSFDKKMRKAKPTLKEYLNSYQNKKLNKSTSDDLPSNANSYQHQISKIDDRVENIKLTLKDKIDK